MLTSSDKRDVVVTFSYFLMSFLCFRHLSDRHSEWQPAEVPYVSFTVDCSYLNFLFCSSCYIIEKFQWDILITSNSFRSMWRAWSYDYLTVATGHMLYIHMKIKDRLIGLRATDDEVAGSILGSSVWNGVYVRKIW